ncbi:hypothetical protein DKL61_10910 [Gammaproteobacteria bacterium ESL0073]|nr:hypothetical protein DKL61_10910 [Gammaproteobacteria bacterium ESL0073]
MIVCPTCGYIRKKEDTNSRFQCPRCQMAYADSLLYQEKIMGQQERLSTVKQEFIPISLFGKCMFFLGLAVVIQVLFSIMSLPSFFWNRAGATIGCYFFIGLITYFIISRHQLWLRLPNIKKIDTSLAIGLIVYFLTVNASVFNAFLNFSLLQHCCILLLNTLSLIIIFGSLVKLLVALYITQQKEKQVIKTMYLGVTLLVYYFISKLPIQNLLSRLDYCHIVQTVFNLIISAFIAVIFIKKTKLAEGVVCSSSILELLKAGITWQVVVLVVKAIVLVIILIIVTMKSNELKVFFSLIPFFSSGLMRSSLLLPYVIKGAIFIVSYGAKVFIFLGVISVIIDTCLPKPKRQFQLR